MNFHRIYHVQHRKIFLLQILMGIVVKGTHTTPSRIFEWKNLLYFEKYMAIYATDITNLYLYSLVALSKETITRHNKKMWLRPSYILRMVHLQTHKIVTPPNKVDRATRKENLYNLNFKIHVLSVWVFSLFA